MVQRLLCTLNTTPITFSPPVCSTGGTNYFSLTDGPTGTDIVRKYDDCYVADDASICDSCGKADVSSTIFIVLTFIFSFMTTMWSYYELFTADAEDGSNKFQIMAILKKGVGLAFAICALVSFQSCYDGMEDDDDIVQVKSYEYGVGVICLILNVLLTVLAAILSIVVMRMKAKSDTKIGAVELNQEMAKEHPHHHHAPHHHSTSSSIAGAIGKKNITDIFDTGELNCDHKGHAHRGFGHSGTHSGVHSGTHSGVH